MPTNREALLGLGEELLFDAEGFALEVRLAMASDNISYRDLAALIGSDQANIHRAAKKALPPSIETYLRLRKWLDARAQKEPDHG